MRRGRQGGVGQGEAGRVESWRRKAGRGGMRLGVAKRGGGEAERGEAWQARWAKARGC